MTDRRLAQILYQATKFLVSLLEKEYGLGKKPDVQVYRVDVFEMKKND